MRIDGLFPIPIGITNINRDFTEDEINFCKEKFNDVKNNAGNVYTQDTFVLENERLFDIKKYIEDQLNVFLKNVYCPSYKMSLYVTQSWINYTKQDGFHHKHSHPNSFVSGVFYINTTDHVDNITFFSPSDNKSSFCIEGSSLNIFNNNAKTMRIAKGDLLLFPSTLQHTVYPIVEKEIRVSIAFNTFFEGSVGSKDRLTYLNLSRN